MGKNIGVGRAVPTSLGWDVASCVASLESVRAYVEGEAERAAAWYLSAKRPKAFFSKGLRLTAIASTVLAGLLPLFLGILAGRGQEAGASGTAAASSGLWATLLVGLAASFIGMDRVFGCSTGWIRYMLTEAAIRKAIEAFRLDWMMLSVRLGNAPASEQVEDMLARAKTFSLSVIGLVADETQAWAAEFEKNLAQLEREAKSQLEEQRQRAEKELKEQRDSTRPGSIELTVTNALGTDDGGFTVRLEERGGSTVEERVSGKTWARLSVPPGPQKLDVIGRRGGAEVRHSAILEVPPNSVIRSDVTLPA